MSHAPSRRTLIRASAVAIGALFVPRLLRAELPLPESPTLRRIREPISTILMEGTRQTDEIRRLREQLGLVAPNQVLTLHVLDVSGALDPKDAIGREIARSLA